MGDAAKGRRGERATRRKGDAAKGRVDEEICRRDLPVTVGRNPDYAKPTSRPRFRACLTSKLGRAEACEGGLGAFGRYALWLCFPDAPGLSHTLLTD
jgi:hypothetical protein